MNSRVISIGKLRGMQQCSNPKGSISILALDHRNNLRKALNPESPDQVSDEAITNFKIKLILALSPAFQAVLLDPEFGSAQCIASGVLQGSKGLIVALEATGYTGKPLARESKILPHWSVEKAKRMGASAVKLLVYYHPESNKAKEIEDLVGLVGAECNRYDIPFFLEPLSYSINPTQPKLPSSERRYVVTETARRLTEIVGVDVLKAEFPIDVNQVPDEKAWEAACIELSNASQVPWVLLSGAVDFPTFLRQTKVACINGASGIAVGRAVWQETPNLSGDQLMDFLHKTATSRFDQLTSVCEKYARAWKDYFIVPEPNSEWYKFY